MTDREAALIDLAYANGMKAAKVMLARGAEEEVNRRISRLTSEAIRALRRPARTDVAALCA